MGQHTRAVIDAITTEKAFQEKVLQYARLTGWLAYHPFDSRHSTEGFPDLVLARAGRIVFAELKSMAGQVRPEQQRWLDALALNPAVETFVWRPTDWPSVERTLR